MPVNELTYGKVILTYLDGSQIAYDNITNVSLSRDWAFLRFEDGARMQVPVNIIREIYEDDGVFVKGVKSEN